MDYSCTTSAAKSVVILKSFNIFRRTHKHGDKKKSKHRAVLAYKLSTTNLRNVIHQVELNGDCNQRPTHIYRIDVGEYGQFYLCSFSEPNIAICTDIFSHRPGAMFWSTAIALWIPKKRRSVLAE